MTQVEGHSLAVSAFGEIVGNNGLAYVSAAKGYLPSGVTPAGMVAYKNGSNGLVIALADEPSTMSWYSSGVAGGAPGHTPSVSGMTWKVPSAAEWQNMFKFLGTNTYDATELNEAIIKAGGNTILWVSYWTADSYNDGNATYVKPGDKYGTSFGTLGKSNARSVRAVISF